MGGSLQPWVIKIDLTGAIDPIKDGVNWCAYCEGNPIGFVDPSGLEIGQLRTFAEDYGFVVEWQDKRQKVAVYTPTNTRSVEFDAKEYDVLNERIIIERTEFLQKLGMPIQKITEPAVYVSDVAAKMNKYAAIVAYDVIPAVIAVYTGGVSGVVGKAITLAPLAEGLIDTAAGVLIGELLRPGEQQNHEWAGYYWTERIATSTDNSFGCGWVTYTSYYQSEDGKNAISITNTSESYRPTTYMPANTPGHMGNVKIEWIYPKK